MHDLTARIDQLLGELAAARDDDERQRVRTELARLNRQKVLRPRPGWDREDWMPIPSVTYSRPAASLQQAELRESVKALFWLLVAGLGEPGSPDQRQFVSLLKTAFVSGELQLTLICPFHQPLAYVAASRGQRQADVMPRVADFGVNHRYGLVEDCLVPVVVSYDRAARTVSLDNHNHLGDPGQFLTPWRCQTTSGLLNMIGAQDIGMRLQRSKTLIVSDLEAVMNKGLDEWFRWLYCGVETGTFFESKRLLVRKANPEEYVYDYDGE